MLPYCIYPETVYLATISAATISKTILTLQECYKHIKFRKNDFAEGSKILNTDPKIILNNLENLKNNEQYSKNFDILITDLSVLHNYFHSSTKLFFYLYSVKILDLSAKSFFPCRSSMKQTG